MPRTLDGSKQWLSKLAYAEPKIIHLRDGEVVLFKRAASPLWQCRYKLGDGSWQRISTKKASIEAAVSFATNLYDEARYRQKLGLAHRAHTFAHIATTTLDELRKQMDAGIGKSVYKSYITTLMSTSTTLSKARQVHACESVALKKMIVAKKMSEILVIF